ncbi:MAG: cytochrome c family protein [Acetobacteraceae bacterium]|nr:cytochrome c family protein [Acetobacteraceae bacterium]
MRCAVGVAIVLALGPAAAQADGDPAAGKTAFVKCMACHSPKQGENKIGPSLFGIVGRPSHSIPGFAYSDPMKNYNVTWDPPTLDNYLVDPRKTVPGTKMIFPGIKSETERSNLIAYLQTLK